VKIRLFITEQVKKKKPLLKRILLTLLGLVLVFACIYWIVATEKFADTKDRKAAYTVNALDFIGEFQENDSAANAKYSDNIITVNGRVSEIEAADTTLNIKFIDRTTGSYAIFAFQEQYLSEAKAIKVGDSISIKGSCSGGIYSDILETTAITFKRSTLNK
jgi:hypothetical protein